MTTPDEGMLKHNLSYYRMEQRTFEKYRSELEGETDLVERLDTMISDLDKFIDMLEDYSLLFLSMDEGERATVSIEVLKPRQEYFFDAIPSLQAECRRRASEVYQFAYSHSTPRRGLLEECVHRIKTPVPPKQHTYPAGPGTLLLYFGKLFVYVIFAFFFLLFLFGGILQLLPHHEPPKPPPDRCYVSSICDAKRH